MKQYKANLHCDRAVGIIDDSCLAFVTLNSTKLWNFTLAIRTSISDDWSSTGFLEAATELEGMHPDREKNKEKRDKERQKERAKVEKEKESDEGKVKASFRSN